MTRHDDKGPDGGGSAGARSVAREWATEARGGRWGTLQELAWSFASERSEFGADYEDAEAALYEVAAGWGFDAGDVSRALAAAQQARAGVCSKLRRARLVRVVPQLRRAVAANDVVRTWAEAA